MGHKEGSNMKKGEQTWEYLLSLFCKTFNTPGYYLEGLQTFLPPLSLLPHAYLFFGGAMPAT
jgi:hypothetical protein